MDLTMAYGINDHPDYGKEFLFVFDDSYTHVIIINTAMPDIGHIPKKNVIGLAWEPLQYLGITDKFLKYAQKHISVYCVGQKGTLPSPFIEHFAFQEYTLKSASELSRNIMSIMISQKVDAPGHIYRHELVCAILKSDLPIDIWGRGCKYYKVNDPRLKGEFDDLKMYDGYTYHVCIENFKLPCYVSEKILNCLVMKTIPVYLGSPLMDKYSIRLSGSVDEDMKLLTQICRYKYTSRHLSFNELVKEFNLGDFIHNYFKDMCS